MAFATEQTILLPRLRGISAAIVNINSESADTTMIVHKSDLLGFAIGLSVKVNEGQVRLPNRYSMNIGCMFNRFSMFSKTNGHTTHDPDLEHCIIHGCLATQDVGKPRVETTKYCINCQRLAANFYGMKHLTCIHTRTPHANTRTHTHTIRMLSFREQGLLLQFTCHFPRTQDLPRIISTRRD